MVTDSVLARYADERLPRYTSYPTAPHFSAAVSSQDYRVWLSAGGLRLYPHSFVQEASTKDRRIGSRGRSWSVRAQSEAIGAALVFAGYVRIGFDHYALPGDPL